MRRDGVHLTGGFVRLEPGTTMNREERTIPSPTDSSIHSARKRTSVIANTQPAIRLPLPRRAHALTQNRLGNARKAAKLTTQDGKPRFLFHDLRRTAVGTSYAPEYQKRSPARSTDTKPEQSSTDTTSPAQRTPPKQWNNSPSTSTARRRTSRTEDTAYFLVGPGSHALWSSPHLTGHS